MGMAILIDMKSLSCIKCNSFVNVFYSNEADSLADC